MHNNTLFLIAAIGCFVVLAILVAGIGGFVRGGDFNHRNSNKMMRWRLIAQAVVIVLLILYVLIWGGS